MPNSTGTPAPGDHRDDDDDALDFPAEAEPTDDTPTIISKTHPIAPPQATKDHVTDIGPRGAMSESVMASLRGRKLAHFELIEPIGVGGMAAVLRAHDTQLDRQVALKILPPDMAADPENVQRFHQEAKAAARLDHENIARVFYCGEDQGLHFIAFEFVEGENIRTLLERRGRLRVSEAVRYILQVALGLEHAAARGVVHRDVKPSNIIVSTNGRAKLVDMGLARHMEPRNSRDLTHSGVTLGTFDYISPEQAMEPRDADTRSDIYSLGCTFYHMLTGQPPVPDGTAAKKLHHHQHVNPIDPRQLNPEIPDEVAMILGKMMEKDPRRRYQQPLQLVQHLGTVARKVGAADDLPEGMLFVDVPMPTGPRSRPLVIVSLVVALLAGMLGVLWLMTNDQVPPYAKAPVGANVAPAGDKKGSGADTPANSGGNPVPPSSEVVKDATALLTAAKDPKLASRTSIKLAKVIRLADLTETIQVAAGPSLVIESKNPDAPATILWNADEARYVEAIALTAGNIRFRRVIFQIETTGYPDVESLAGIVVRGARQVVFEKCQFEQAKVPPFNPAQPHIASVLIEGDSVGDSGPLVEFNECYFTGPENKAGEIAIAVNGAATVSARNCGFKPFGSFFQFQSLCSLKKTFVKLENCSGFVHGSPVFRFDADAAATLAAKKCVFSRSKRGIDTKGFPEPNLLRQADETEITFQGEKNVYDKRDALWLTGPNLKAGDLEAFRAELAKSQGQSYDRDSVEVGGDDDIWMAPDNPGPLYAFQLRPRYAVLRVGLLSGPGGGAMPEPPAEEIFLAERTKLFDPEYTGKQRSDIFASFEKAWANLNAGETLLIKPRKDGSEIELPPIEINKPGVDVTIKAFDSKGPAPLLALSKIAEKKHLAFFKLLVDGKLRFEGLHFLLEPRQAELLSQSVLLLGDSAQCAFERCVITLKPGKAVPLQVVSFVAPGSLMKMDDQPRSGNLQVDFSNSYVRGQGDLVAMRWCRSLKGTLKNSLFALSGSLVDIQASGEEVPVDQNPLEIVMNQVSAFTKDSAVFSLRSAMNGKGLGRSKLEAHQCLFSPAERASSRPLITLAAADIVSEDQIKDYVQWKGDQNCFPGFSRLLELERPNEMGVMMKLEPMQWAKVFEEAKMRTDDLTFAGLGETPLWQALPDKFRPIDAPPDFVETGIGATAKDMDALAKSLK